MSATTLAPWTDSTHGGGSMRRRAMSQPSMGRHEDAGQAPWTRINGYCTDARQGCEDLDIRRGPSPPDRCLCLTRSRCNPLAKTREAAKRFPISTMAARVPLQNSSASHSKFVRACISRSGLALHASGSSYTLFFPRTGTSVAVVLDRQAESQSSSPSCRPLLSFRG